MRLLPVPPSPPEGDAGGARRFDGMITATALVWGLPLLHENARDFEPFTTQQPGIRSGYRAWET